MRVSALHLPCCAEYIAEKLELHQYHCSPATPGLLCAHRRGHHGEMAAIRTCSTAVPATTSLIRTHQRFLHSISAAHSLVIPTANPTTIGRRPGGTPRTFRISPEADRISRLCKNQLRFSVGSFSGTTICLGITRRLEPTASHVAGVRLCLGLGWRWDGAALQLTRQRYPDGKFRRPLATVLEELLVLFGCSRKLIVFPGCVRISFDSRSVAFREPPFASG